MNSFKFISENGIEIDVCFDHDITPLDMFDAIKELRDYVDENYTAVRLKDIISTTETNSEKQE